LRIQQAIDNANQEVSRGALDITPVRLDSTELYPILRSRLFERVPDPAERRAVGQAYAQAYRTAVQQGVMLGSFERWAQEISESYPFHPGLHELFARFRENPGFQQTREMLRLTRRIVADLWETKRAEQAMLIHPHALDIADQDVAATIERINPRSTTRAAATSPTFSTTQSPRHFHANSVVRLPLTPPSCSSSRRLRSAQTLSRG
jgi:predicted AAA+ superfamily ATPase